MELESVGLINRRMRWSAEALPGSFMYLDEGIKSFLNKYAIGNKVG